jgi:hypothetical protein
LKEMAPLGGKPSSINLRGDLHRALPIANLDVNTLSRNGFRANKRLDLAPFVRARDLAI